VNLTRLQSGQFKSRACGEITARAGMIGVELNPAFLDKVALTLAG
jgi:hypothetical protein